MGGLISRPHQIDLKKCPTYATQQVMGCRNKNEVEIPVTSRDMAPHFQTCRARQTYGKFQSIIETCPICCLDEPNPMEVQNTGSYFIQDVAATRRQDWNQSHDRVV
jgi:hypothetical protein